MQVTVTFALSDAVCPLDVAPDMELENFKALVQVENGSNTGMEMVFFHNGKILLGDKKALSELGVSENDVLLFGPAPQNMQNVSQPPQHGQPVSSAPSNIQRNTAGACKIYSLVVSLRKRCYLKTMV